MRWQSPHLLWLLWLVPLVCGLLLRSGRKQAEAARIFATGNMRQRIIPRFSRSRSWGKVVLLSIGLALLIVAVARPKYGAYYEEVAQNGVDLFVLLDVSRSMLAEDIAPNRLERAKSDIVDLLHRIPTDRVGLIVFAGKAVTRIPLTNDHTFFRQMLRDVDVDSAPVGGSLIGDAIRNGIAAMPHRSDRDQVLVLITDGEDHDSFPLDAAKLAAERGVKIIAVGLGDTDNGARIPERSVRRSVGFVKDRTGQEVWSRMDEDLLKKIALQTSGAYVPARTMAYDLGQIYDDHLSHLTRGELRSGKRKRFREQFQWFTAIALAMLAGESLIGRRSSVATMLAFALLFMPASAAKAADVTSISRKAFQAYDDGDFDRAAELFAEAAKGAQDDPRFVFNQACARAAGDDPESARDLFFEAALARDPRLSADAHFNLSCIASNQAKALLGDDPLAATKEQRTESIELLNQSMRHLRDALRSDPSHVNARHNLETIRLWAKQMKALWDQKDREQRQNGTSALQMLTDMDKRQLAQRSILRQQAPKADSPTRHEQIQSVRQQQLLLIDDVEPLQQKLVEELTAAMQGQAAPNPSASSPTKPNPTAPNVSNPGMPPTDPRIEAIRQGIGDGMNRLASAMENALQQIDDDDIPAALAAQRDSLEVTNQIYLVIAPFQDALQRAILDQKGRIQQTQRELEKDAVAPDADTTSQRNAAEPHDQNDNEDNSDRKDETRRNERTERDGGKAADGVAAYDFRALDLEALRWRQLRVAQWTESMVRQAEQQLPVAQRSTDQAPANASSKDKDKADASDENEEQRQADPGQNGGPTAASNGNGTAPSPSAHTEQKQPMVEAMEKTLELGPKVVQLAKAAAELLEDGDFETALPKQDETLKLLKEIAESLPRDQDQQQGDSQQDGSGQDQEDGNRDPQQGDPTNGDQSGGDRKSDSQESNSKDSDGDPQQNSDPSNTEQGSNGEQPTHPPNEQNEETQNEEGQNDESNDRSEEATGDREDGPEDKDEKKEPPAQGTSDEPNDEANPPSEGDQGIANESDDVQDLSKQNAMTRARVESILQRVRDRERQYRQIQKQIRNLLQKRKRPEKDW